MVTHIVFFNIKLELNKTEVLAELKTKLLALSNSIKEINHIEFGINFNNVKASYDAALYTTFNTKTDLDAYQIHPEHIKVKTYIGTICSDRAVVDYEM